MKIRLKVTTPAGESRLFEHEGPVVRIGRDPECELLLEGEAGTAASREHARIDLGSGSARLTDLGSSNHTLHNDKVAERPVALRPGDRIQIGYTGSTLVVLELDLTTKEPLPAPPVDRGVLIAGGLVGGLLVLGATFFFVMRKQQPPPDTGPDVVVTQGAGAPPTGQPDKGPVVKPAPPPPPPPPPPVDPLLPSAEVKKIGFYLRRPDVRPSVLLQRAGENHPWVVLRSGQAISTGHTFISLPGYESLVFLDCGVRLNLWGNLPEFSPSDVRETIVLLNDPPAGVDADLILDRGRVEIACTQASRACVRVRFVREAWDITLSDPGSKVCIELGHQHVVGAPSGPVVKLFTRGKVLVKTGKQDIVASSPAQLTWLSWRPEPVQQEKLAEPPVWWEKAPAGTAAVAETWLSLKDWALKPKRLDESNDGVVETILTVVREASNDRTDRLIGLLFLSALDEVHHLAKFLEDQARDDAAVRGTAILGLQDWLVRNASRRSFLVRQLQRHGYSSRTADLIVKLLAPFSLEAVKEPETYQSLIDQLDHENLPVRHLASWHLYFALAFRMPPGALKIPYDPTWEEAKRQEAVTSWRKLLPAGKVPEK